MGSFHLGFLTYLEVIVDFLSSTYWSRIVLIHVATLVFLVLVYRMVEVGRELVEIICSNPVLKLFHLKHVVS